MTFQPPLLTRVYFLRPVGKKGPIKIGSSGRPLSRLNAFRTWSPVALELVAHTKATCNTESYLHRFFLDGWLHGEWFAWSQELQSLIDHINQHDEWPEWVKPPGNHPEWSAFFKRFPKGKPKKTVPPIFPEDDTQ